MSTLTLCSWNINGIRSISKKEGLNALTNFDIICLQEIRCDNTIAQKLIVEKYGHIFPHIKYNISTDKKGYSGTAILSKLPIKACTFDLSGMPDNKEGRVITAHIHDFILVNVYTPNSGNDLKRLEYRSQWDHVFNDYIDYLKQHNPRVIVCGDLNVARQPIDIWAPNTKAYEKNAGYTPEERNGIETILKRNELIDTYRHFHPTDRKYSWWSNFNKSREQDKGWRIDYWLTTQPLLNLVKEADILTHITGSDHAPVSLTIHYR